MNIDQLIYKLLWEDALHTNGSVILDPSRHKMVTRHQQNKPCFLFHFLRLFELHVNKCNELPEKRINYTRLQDQSMGSFADNDGSSHLQKPTLVSPLDFCDEYSTNKFQRSPTFHFCEVIHLVTWQRIRYPVIAVKKQTSGTVLWNRIWAIWFWENKMFENISYAIDLQNWLT